MQLFLRPISLALLLAMVPAASAQTTYFRDMFDTNGPLIGLTPNVGSGTWQQTGSNPANPLTVSSNALNIGTFGQDAYGTYTQGVPITAGNRLYTGVDINVSTATASGFYFLHMSRSAGSQSLFLQPIYIRSSGAGFQVGIASTSGTAANYGSTILNFNQTYRVVSSWEFAAGAANDVMNVYIDPTNAIQGNNTPYIANHQWAGDSEPTGFLPAVNIMQGAASMSPSLSIDRLVVTNDFGVVSFIPVPEPSLVFGLSFGVMGLLVRLRKISTSV
jgi:hypothetical protein